MKIFLFYADEKNVTQQSPGVCNPYELLPKGPAILAGAANVNQVETEQYCFFTDSSEGKKWKKILNVFSTPELLFALQHPDYPPPSSTGGAFMFVAKLVSSQITTDNVSLMLKICRDLKFRKRGDKIEWYNPEMGIEGVGIENINGAPGTGFLIGLNPFNQEVQLEGGQFTLDHFLQMIKGMAPWLIGAGIFAVANQKKV